MKTIAASAVAPSDLVGAVAIAQNASNVSIYYDGDILPNLGPSAAAVSAALQDRYDDALMSHFNEVAAQRHYDSYLTAALRAGYVGPFQAEGIAFGSWMDSCNAQGYALIAAVQAGTKPLPTIPDFIAGLPAMAWPTP